MANGFRSADKTTQQNGQLLLTALIEQQPIADLVSDLLAADAPKTLQRVALKAIASTKQTTPATWVEPLNELLSSEDPIVLTEAIAAVSALAGDHFLESLRNIENDPSRSASVRMSALSAIALRSGKLDDATLLRLIEIVDASSSPTSVDRATQIIGQSQLTLPQLEKVCHLLVHASPGQLRDLMRGFARRLSEPLANDFLNALESSSSLLSLAEHELSDVIKRFPPQTLERANGLLDRLKEKEQNKRLRLESLRNQLDRGVASRGEAIFRSEEAKCSSCHRVADFGRSVGPNLSSIGSNRSASDLFESILFPSASIVRDYGTFQVLTVDGRVVTGLLARETTSEVQIQVATGELINIALEDIEQVTPSPISTMPAGLDETLTQQQLLDVVRYLQSLRSE